MTFTDSDLKRLKYYLEEPIHSAEELDKEFSKNGKALLARLEASEQASEAWWKWSEEMRKESPRPRTVETLGRATEKAHEVWRRAAGK